MQWLLTQFALSAVRVGSLLLNQCVCGKRPFGGSSTNIGVSTPFLPFVWYHQLQQPRAVGHVDSLGLQVHATVSAMYTGSTALARTLGSFFSHFLHTMTHKHVALLHQRVVAFKVLWDGYDRFGGPWIAVAVAVAAQLSRV